MPTKPQPDALLAAVDALIATHGGANPQLLNDLQNLRTELAAHIASRRKTDLANTALRIAQLIKFAFDLMDGSG